MAVREGLLALLNEGPSHGYQLKTSFESATGGAWPLNVGQVYTTLDRLQRDGLVTSDEADDRSGTPSPPPGARSWAAGGRPCPAMPLHHATSSS
jgi:Transcriptional regulator PadR-like family